MLEILSLFSSTSRHLSQERICVTKIILSITTVAFNTTSAIYIFCVSDGEMAAYVSAVLWTCILPFVGFALVIILSIVVINYSTDTTLSLEIEQQMRSKITKIHIILVKIGTSVVFAVISAMTHYLVAAAPETYVNYLLASFICSNTCVCVYFLNRLSLEVVELTKMGIHARKGDLNAKKAVQTGLIMLKDILKKSSSQSPSGLSKTMNTPLKSKKGSPATHNPPTQIIYSVPDNESGLAKTRIV
jgi:hypothetical protein